jgi:mono/diheme cytochrome c family protein
MNCHPNGEEGAGPQLFGPNFEARFPTDDLIVRQVRNGKGEMPPIAPDMVSDEALAHIIAFIRTLGK